MSNLSMTSSMLKKVTVFANFFNTVTFLLLFIKLYTIILVKELILMENKKKYYENTKYALPNPMVKKFINMNIKPQNAIDLGCGAGRDTIYLIKNGWKVLSIDKENTKELISSKLDSKEIKKFRFNVQNFEDIKLEKNNLLVANFSIPFCSKDYFNEFWNKINDSILKDRILCWKLFWIK